MAGRCKACNSILTEQELKTKYIGTNTYTELCDRCSDLSDEYYDILNKIERLINNRNFNEVEKKYVELDKVLGKIERNKFFKTFIIHK